MLAVMLVWAAFESDLNQVKNMYGKLGVRVEITNKVKLVRPKPKPMPESPLKSKIVQALYKQHRK